MNNQQPSSEFQNFIDGKYYKPTINEIPSLYRDYQIYVMNQISQFNLITNEEDKPLYYWLKGLDDSTFQKVHYEFLILKEQIIDFRESFDYLITSVMDIPKNSLDDFVISCCGSDDGIVEDDFNFHLNNKVRSIIGTFGGPLFETSDVLISNPNID